MITAIIMSIAIAFNFVILLWKLRNGRKVDTLVDLGCMFILSFLFQGTLGGMAVAMLAGSLISLYLLINPVVIKLPKRKQSKGNQMNSIKTTYRRIRDNQTFRVIGKLLIVVALIYTLVFMLTKGLMSVLAYMISMAWISQGLSFIISMLWLIIMTTIGFIIGKKLSPWVYRKKDQTLEAEIIK